MSGQTLNDRLTAARHALAGQGLARIVCKATTEEVIGPKKKHLDYLLHCTNEPNVSIPQLANLLIERTQQSSWVVVFKSLITVHHLMCYGNERFTQYLASSNCTFQLGTFLDKCGVQGYDMSTFIRRYAKYLNEKAVSYRSVAFDFCKCKRGKEDGILRTMNTDKLLKTLPSLQSQLDALLEFDCSSNDLSNGVVNSCFMLLFRDLIRLFACYNDGIINLLEKYFDMNKKHCREALDLYKKFLIRMDRVAEFLKVAENVGIDKGEIPDLTKAPGSLLEALEQHLASLEGRRGSTPAASSVTRNAVTALMLTSNAFGSVGEGSSPTQEINGIKVDETVKKAVEEEAEVMSQLKFDNESPLLWEQPAWEDSERRMKEITGETSPPPGSSKTNPFLSSPCEANMAPTTTSNQEIIDLFNTTASHDGKETPSAKNTSDDLLCLSSNPFMDSFHEQQKPQQTDQVASNTFVTNGFSNSAVVTTFATDASFATAFGDTIANQGIVSSSIATSSATGKSPARLNLPVLEPFGGRSTSPSPTTELMQGAGTTPILANPPDGIFGDVVEATEDTTQVLHHAEASDFIWGAQKSPSPTVPSTTAPGPGVENDLFGAPFEIQSSSATQPPTAIVPPLSMQSSASEAAPKGDLFGFDGGEFADFVEQPMSAQPCAPPPSPFGGLDVSLASVGGSTPDLRAQALANAGAAAVAASSASYMQQKPSASSGIDDLNFAIQKAMQGPATLTSVPTCSSPTLSSSLPGPGIMHPRPGLVGQAFPPSATVMTPGSTFPPASSSLTHLDSLGSSGQVVTPTGRASSTPGYGTPPSGLSSPAKSVSGFGASGTGSFDMLGESGSNKSGSSDKIGSSTLLKGDLDSTLVSLASNLDINGPKQSLKKTSGHQWGSPKPVTKTGVVGWSTPPTVGAIPGAATGNVGWSSAQHGFQSVVAPTNQWGTPGVITGSFPPQPAAPVLQQQPFMMAGVRPMSPAIGGVPMGMNVGVNANQQVQQPVLGGIASQIPAVPFTGSAFSSQSAHINDPFGAL